MPGQQEQSHKTKISLRDILYLFFRHKWKIISFSLIGILGVVVSYLITPTFYRSEAKLLVRYVTESTTLDPTANSGRILSPDQRGQNIINSEIEILYNVQLVQEVIDDIGFQRLAPQWDPIQDRQRLSLSWLRNLEIQVPSKSSVIKVSVQALHPDYVQQFLQRLVERYLEKHFDLHRGGDGYDFLAQQTDQVRSRLTQIENQLRDLKTEAGVASIDEAALNIAKRIEDLHVSLREAEGERAASFARLEVLKRSSPLPSQQPSSAPSSDQQTDVTQARLIEYLKQLREREQELLSMYTEQSLPIEGIRSQLAEVEAKLKGQSAGESEPLPLNVSTNTELGFAISTEEANVASIDAKIKILKTYQEHTENEARRIHDLNSKVTQLERQKEIQDTNYRYFSERLEQARIDDALDVTKISNISVVQPATAPVQTRPDLSRNVGIALAFGLLGGLGLAFVSEQFLDLSIKHPGEVKSQLGLPLLITIPAFSQNGMPQVEKRTNGTNILLPEDASIAGEGRKWDVRDALSERYEVLRDRVLMSSVNDDETKPCVLGITSCHKGAGVSSVATGLAVILSRNNDGNVLLVDTNLDNAAPHSVFELDRGKQEPNEKQPSEEKIQKVQHNLSMLSACGYLQKLPKMSMTNRYNNFRTFLTDSKYDFVIFDMPPISDSSLALRYLRYMQGIVLVIQSEKSHRDRALHVKGLLESAGANVLGVVLNKRKHYIPSWVYKRI